jgi:hypothetical protein
MGHETLRDEISLKSDWCSSWFCTLLESYNLDFFFLSLLNAKQSWSLINTFLLNHFVAKEMKWIFTTLIAYATLAASAVVQRDLFNKDEVNDMANSKCAQVAVIFARGTFDSGYDMLHDTIRRLICKSAISGYG